MSTTPFGVAGGSARADDEGVAVDGGPRVVDGVLALVVDEDGGAECVEQSSPGRWRESGVDGQHGVPVGPDAGERLGEGRSRERERHEPGHRSAPPPTVVPDAARHRISVGRMSRRIRRRRGGCDTLAA
ncbi:MAG: hypothetical protein U5R31_14295 [Acidimicrobiia bacterium]|nr:hypothetical protein [Acidimicrobiia bacterium]